MNPDLVRQAITPFASPSNKRAIFELVVTLTPLAFFWFLTFRFAQSNPLFLLLLVPVTSLFLVRSFMILHDCAHYAFFDSKRLNVIAGRLIGILCVTPFAYWRRTHSLHHASAGNLDGRGFGDVPTFTVDEYRALNPLSRLGYRIMRHPLILFSIAPFYVFVIQPRLPVGMMRQGWKLWASTLGTDIVLFLVFWVLVSSVGWYVTLISTLPIFALSASIGVWLNFVQHNFEGSRFWSKEDWRFAEAAIVTSSNYVLPQPLRWFTADIGMHHVHHLNSRIPYYRLPAAMTAVPGLEDYNRVPMFKDSYCFSRTLWDETRQSFVTPKEATQLRELLR